MSDEAFAEWSITTWAHAVFDLGKPRLKSGQFQAARFVRFAAKNLWIQLIGHYPRMARELPKIKSAADRGRERRRAKTAAKCGDRQSAFWNFGQGWSVLGIGS